MSKLNLFLLGLPTSWLVAEIVLLIPSAWLANIFEAVFTTKPSDVFIDLAFNISESLFAFCVVTLAICFAKLLPMQFSNNKNFLLFGCLFGYTFIFGFAMLTTSYRLEGALFFGNKLLFQILGVFLAWLIFTKPALAPSQP